MEGGKLWKSSNETRESDDELVVTWGLDEEGQKDGHWNGRAWLLSM